jgi:hypothetical protein
MKDKREKKIAAVPTLCSARWEISQALCSLAQCEFGSYRVQLVGHATCTMETIAEDAEGEYELGNCV